MATINLTTLPEHRFRWETVTGNDVGEVLWLQKGGAQIAVQVTGTFGDTLTMQGTIDGTTWFSLLSGPGGEAVTFTAAGYAEISTAVWGIRPSAGASITDVDVYLRVIV